MPKSSFLLFLRPFRLSFPFLEWETKEMRWESLGDGGARGILLRCCAARERGDSRGKGSTAAARVCLAIRQISGPFICLAPLFTTVCTHLGDTMNMYLPTARHPPLPSSHFHPVGAQTFFLRVFSFEIMSYIATRSRFSCLLNNTVLSFLLFFFCRSFLR